MRKCFRYLLMFNVVNYLTALGFAGGILAGCYLTGVPATGRGLFYGYFTMFPSMLLLVAMFSGTAYATSSLNHVLSFGAKRTDYFWGMMGQILFSTLIYSLMNAAFLALPEVLGWHPDFTGPAYSPIFPLSLVTWHAIGCAVGRLTIRSRAWGGVVAGASVFLLLLNPIYETITIHTGNLWGDLPWITLSASLLITFGCLFWTYGVIQNATVR